MRVCLHTTTSIGLHQVKTIHGAILIASMVIMFLFWSSHTRAQAFSTTETPQSLTLSVQPEAGGREVTAHIINGSDQNIYQTTSESSSFRFKFVLDVVESGDDMPLIRFDSPAHLACFVSYDLALNGSTIELKAGDINNDDWINDADIAAMHMALYSGSTDGDINHDRQINILDLIYVGRNYGRQTGQCTIELSSVIALPSEIPPSATPTMPPSATPTMPPSATPTTPPTATPTTPPSATPTMPPSATPTMPPTATPTMLPSATLTIPPSATPTTPPTATPTTPPTTTPTMPPSATPTTPPSATPTMPPSATPTTPPTATALMMTVAPTSTSQP